MAYDRAGNLESLLDARNNTQSFEYNGDGRLIRETDALGQVWETTYDAYGNKVSETEPNGRKNGVRSISVTRVVTDKGD